jgi:hypothetical protein
MFICLLYPQLFVRFYHNCILLSISVDQARSTFYVVQDNFGKFRLHVSNMQFSAQNEVWISIDLRKIIRITVIV